MFNHLINQCFEILNLNTQLASSFNFVLLIPILWFSFFIIIFLIIYFITKKSRNKVISILDAYAQGRGAQFVGDISWSIRPLVSGTTLGVGRTWGNYGVRHQVNDKVVTTSIWTTKVGSGKDSKITRYQIAIIPIKFNRQGWIYTRREHFFDRLGNLLGFNDLDFEDQTFSNKYYVRANPEKFGYDFFHPRMMQLFLNYPNYQVIVKFDHVIIYFGVGSLSGYFALRKYPRENLREIQWMEYAKYMALEVEKLIPTFMRYDT